MSHSPAEIEARLRLLCLPQLGPRRQRRLLEAFGSASAALSAPAPAWQSLGIPSVAAQARRSDQVRGQVLAAQRWLEGVHNHLLLWQDADYPALLAEVVDAPSALFVQGELSALALPQLAIVGSRRASVSGLDTAHAFAQSLAGAGFAITSGLALGIDGAAHQGALAADGRTLAVLGTGLDCLYPRRHSALAARIVELQGALLSELLPQTPPLAQNFPRRNRLISGLSLGVLVVEASPQSGSLITTRLAAEQGREVFAIPGSIHHPGARGCHQLLREGANLVESVGDILQQLRGWQNLPPESSAVAPPVAEQQQHPVLALLSAAPASAEQIAHHLGWPLPQVLVALSEFEIEQKINAEQGVWMLRHR